MVRLGRKSYQRWHFTSVGAGETRVWLNVPPEARSFHILLITEEQLDDVRASGSDVALEGEMPGIR